MRTIRSALVLALAASLTAVLAATPAQAAACPDGGYRGTPGERIKSPDNATVYMVDPEGYRRPIVGTESYTEFFRSWSGIRVRSDISRIPRGADLTWSYNWLARDLYGSYFFVEQYGSYYRARGIPSVAVYDKYHFRWDNAHLMDSNWLGRYAGPAWT